MCHDRTASRSFVRPALRECLVQALHPVWGTIPAQARAWHSEAAPSTFDVIPIEIDRVLWTSPNPGESIAALAPITNRARARAVRSMDQGDVRGELGSRSVG